MAISALVVYTLSMFRLDIHPMR